MFLFRNILVNLYRTTDGLLFATNGIFTIFDTFLMTTNELIFGTDVITWRVSDTFLPMFLLDTLGFSMMVLSTEVDWLVIGTEFTFLECCTNSNSLLGITEMIWNPFSTETSLLLSNTELSIDKLDTFLGITLLETEFDFFMFDTLLGLCVFGTNLVTLLLTESMIISISPSLVVFTSDLLPSLLTFTNCLIL